MGLVGVAVTGAAIYNALDARGQDAPAHEIQDSCDGHPERSGQYHYHNLSECLPDKRSQPGGHSDVLGYALDGFAFFGRYGEGGRVVTNADLDTCHGHSHVVEWDGEKRDIYHYHFTAEYPYTVGCFRGKVEAASAEVGGITPQPDGRAMLRKAAAELGVSEQRLAELMGPPPPNFARAAKALGVPEARLRQAMGAPKR
jgi:hypothetical protein